MKCDQWSNTYLFLLFGILFFHIELVNCKSSTFLDIAKEEVWKLSDNDPQDQPDTHEKYVVSLNSEYYTPKGIQEVEHCRNLYSTNYDKCQRFTTCNFCSANSDCGWCDEKKICLPIDLNSRSDELVPLCQGDCIRILKIDFCYKVLFEPEHNKGEINFSNYDEVVNNEKNIALEDDNIFERTLEKTFLAERNHKSDNTSTNLQANANQFHFKQKNNPSLDYNPNASTNKPLSINLDAHHQRLYKEMEDTSKDIFNSLLYDRITKRRMGNLNLDSTTYGNKPAIMSPDIKTKKEKTEEMMKALKDFIPNFEFPQFVKSDLEDSINKIKKEKLLLWLRGYSLNEDISKRHLPIYQNLTFANEDSVREEFLDKFYKDIMNNPRKKPESLPAENIRGESTLFGDKIPPDKYTLVKGGSTGTISKPSPSDITVNQESFLIPVAKTNFVQAEKPFRKRIIGPPPTGLSPKFIDMKNFKVVNSKYIDPNDLMKVIQRDNMRFKEKDSSNHSLKGISQQLKDFLANDLK